MTCEQCEREVIKKMREIQELVTEYMGQSPEFISAYYHGGHNTVSINNDYHTGDYVCHPHCSGCNGRSKFESAQDKPCRNVYEMARGA